MYRIVGKDRKYGTTAYYGDFKTLKSCLTHMNFLMRSYGNIISFKCLGVDKT